MFMICTVPLRENFTGKCCSEHLGGKTCHMLATNFFPEHSGRIWTGECYTFQEISRDVIKSYPQQGRLSDNLARIKRNIVNRANEFTPNIPNHDLHSIFF